MGDLPCAQGLVEITSHDVHTFAQAEVTDHQYQVDTDGRTTGAGVVDVDAHDGKVISATSHGPAQSSSGNDCSQSRICRTRVRNVEMFGPNNALERVPSEQDSATSEGCDSEACSECRVFLKICRPGGALELSWTALIRGIVKVR